MEKEGTAPLGGHDRVSGAVRLKRRKDTGWGCLKRKREKWGGWGERCGRTHKTLTVSLSYRLQPLACPRFNLVSFACVAHAHERGKTEIYIYIFVI